MDVKVKHSVSPRLSWTLEGLYACAREIKL